MMRGAVAIAAALAAAATMVAPMPDATAAAAGAAFGRSYVAPGVQIWQERWRGAGGLEHAWLAGVNLGNRSVRATVLAAHAMIGGRRETTAAMAVRARAAVGINGDFFYSNGVPLGGVIHDGQILRSPRHTYNAQLTIRTNGTAVVGPVEYRATVADMSGSSAPIYSINTFADATAGRLTELTPALGRVRTSPSCLYAVGGAAGGMLAVRLLAYLTETPSLSGNTRALVACSGGARSWLLLHARRGRHLRIRQGLGGGGTSALLSGGRVLIRNGRAAWDTTGLATIGRNPETAVCVSRDQRHLLLAVIDGRSRTSAGLTMNELTSFLLANHCYVALMLDGGGSSTFVARTAGRVHTLNHPSDRTGQRGVPDGLFITG